MEEFRIDEADQNTAGERTWGVIAPSAYVVVTESIHSGTLRSEAISGTATAEELSGAIELVRRRRRRDKLIARIEVCDALWRTLVSMKSETHEEPSAKPRLQGIKFMMDAVEGHRSVAQESLVELTQGNDDTRSDQGHRD